MIGEIAELVYQLNKEKRACYWFEYSGHVDSFNITRSYSKKDFMTDRCYLGKNGFKDSYSSFNREDLLCVLDLLKKEREEIDYVLNEDATTMIGMSVKKAKELGLYE